MAWRTRQLGAVLRGDGGNGRNGGATIVPFPGTLGWTPTFTIVESSGVHSIGGFDFDALKPTPVYNYYVSPTGSAVASPADNDPLTPITARRFVTLANANGGVVRGYCAGGKYWGNLGPDGNNLTGAGVVLEPWVGQGTGRPIFIKRSANVAPVWTLTAGNTYQTPFTAASIPCYDASVTDAGGCYQRLVDVGSQAACEATPGTYFYNGSTTMFCHATDGRNLIGDTNIILGTGATNFNFTGAINKTLWMSGIDCFGPFVVTQSGVGMLTQFYNRDCGFYGIGSAGLLVTGPSEIYSLSPREGGGNSDSLNYHGNAQGDPKYLEYDVRSIRSGYDAAGINNNSTAHENAIGICVAGDYAGSQNRVVNDISAAKRFMVGCTVRASLAADATAITISAGISGAATVHMWLYGCTVENSATAALYADSGCTINYTNMSIAGLTTAGSGTIAAYTP